MRLIDADELKTAFPCGEYVRTESVRATIDHMPTVDRPQEFVRCKDCKWWGRHVEFKDGSTMIDCKKGKSMNADGYCHYGERKVEE